ncbi:hypothetical protein [Desulfopila inferna]|uniref:hypothetical protein n=1 Tax=Desulfopila inferna TaxID=468528 RepID=UPI00196563B3|nr:hypothetical protein [Desulfopila inferna]MBM9602648.1 hypothetical protein [Desulfopila inferna]
MTKKIKKIHGTESNTSRRKNVINHNIRFIVPMPGKSCWHGCSSTQLAFKKIHTFSECAGDFALEDYQAQFLMDREYLID